jgi:hypothetical protein
LLAADPSGYGSLDDARMQAMLADIGQCDAVTYGLLKAVPCTILGAFGD